mgnify:CR=1 FL=1
MPDQYLDVFLKKEDFMMRDMIRNFVDKEIMPVRQQIDDDKDHIIVKKILQGITDLGIQKGAFPKEYGGGGMTSLVSAAIMHEELARGDSGIATAATVTTWAFLPAIIAGNKAVLDRFAPEFCGKALKMGCFAMTEPGGDHGAESVGREGEPHGGVADRLRAEVEDVRPALDRVQVLAVAVADLGGADRAAERDAGDRERRGGAEHRRDLRVDARVERAVEAEDEAEAPRVGLHLLDLVVVPGEGHRLQGEGHSPLDQAADPGEALLEGTRHPRDPVVGLLRHPVEADLDLVGPVLREHRGQPLGPVDRARDHAAAEAKAVAP